MEVQNEIRREEVSDDLLDHVPERADNSFVWEDEDTNPARKSKRRRGRKRGRGKGRRGRQDGDDADNSEDELSTSVPAASTGVFTEQVTKVKIIEYS